MLSIFVEENRTKDFYLFICNFFGRLVTQGPEEMCLSLEHQNPSKTFEKTGYFDRVTVSLHIL